MPDPLAGLPPRFLRTPEAARFLGLSGRTLEKHRTYGTGPKYRKIGGRVIYGLDDLKAWADLGAKSSTADPGVGTVFPAKRRLIRLHQRSSADDRSWPRARRLQTTAAAYAVMRDAAYAVMRDIAVWSQRTGRVP
jgi:predicted DNA-binding transcriptional regulator AlpA